MSYMGTIRKNGQYRAIVQKYTNINYASAILISYDLSTARYFRKAAGEWKVPVNFISNNDLLINGTSARLFVDESYGRLLIDIYFAAGNFYRLEATADGLKFEKNVNGTKSTIWTK